MGGILKSEEMGLGGDVYLWRLKAKVMIRKMIGLKAVIHWRQLQLGDKDTHDAKQSREAGDDTG